MPHFLSAHKSHKFIGVIELKPASEVINDLFLIDFLLVEVAVPQ